MKQDAYLMPKEDRWVVQRWLSMIMERLCSNQPDPPAVRRTLLRFLLGLQRLPRFTDGINLSIEVDDYQLVFSSEELGLHVFTDDGHAVFRLQYFQGSYHCIQGYDLLTGEEKRDSVEFHLECLANAMQVEPALRVEDHSRGEAVDRPVTDPIWGSDPTPAFLVDEGEIHE